ncbi:type II toxin-antitoxin system VapC family toxin [Stygiolobus caldivivus]|uniref:PIN domain nuclease n=1 Tax=Stygiolobus caldivivus TaxID=2824673 RepID=A0A8D5U3L9_9CREN|nr:PIN domain-containing protein [Stygiolobus caldivivus]BCU68756.1 PIN domain nuclease [Stygiolobus caldivivus]
MSDPHYVDTNVILSLVEEDPNYEKAIRIRDIRNLVTGEVTVLELNSFYSRKLKDEIKAKAAALYSLKFSDVRVTEVDWNRLLRKSEELSLRLQLKTLDILQISSATLIGAPYFLTFDKDILGKKELVKMYTGIEVNELSKLG